MRGTTPPKMEEIAFSQGQDVRQGTVQVKSKSNAQTPAEQSSKAGWFDLHCAPIIGLRNGDPSNAGCVQMGCQVRIKYADVSPQSAHRTRQPVHSRRHAQSFESAQHCKLVATTKPCAFWPQPNATHSIIIDKLYSPDHFTTKLVT